MVPVILLGGMYTGYFTSTEAAAICVLYTLIVSMFVYKKLTFKDLPGIFMSVAKSTGTVVGCCAALAEGDAAKRTDIFFLEPLPLFAH